MSLFQKSVVNKYLKNLNQQAVEEAYKQFQQFYDDAERIENIRLLKEENYQEGFLREIFVDVLGYTINPNKNYDLTTEYKNETDSKKADGAILQDGKAIGVIELKSTKTPDLESIRDQAFNYKNNQSNCRYVITSNFEKLRFYIDNATDWEEFNLFHLDYDNFCKLYLFLNKDNIFNGITAKLKEESKLHEEDVTGKLYNDYSIFKQQLFNDLIKHNPKTDKLLLFHKSQKLLDRILFILFAEDRGLLPPNAITKIVDQWKSLKELDEEKSLYSRFVKLFHHLDEGHKYKEYELPAYNGGLFKKDEVIDNLIISNEVLHSNSLKLSTYDFNTEVDVNILGHIFENSITEIEQVKAEIEGQQSDKNRSRRKKEGIFYTPKYITKYIVDNTVGTLCAEKKNELGIDQIENEIIENSRTSKGKLTKKAESLLQKLNEYRDYLKSLKILDPACGSGAFLNQALEFLINEQEQIDSYRRELEQDSLGLYDITKSILENNLYGVDINEEAVEIAKLSLWIRTAERGRKLSDLSSNIKCGNSLIDDPAVAGAKAFNWVKEFPQVFKTTSPSIPLLAKEREAKGEVEIVDGGFDVVIGNPPYVRAESILHIKPFLSKNYSAYNGNADLYIYFYEKSVRLLKSNGSLGLITPNKWIQSNYGKELRSLLSNYVIRRIIDFGELEIFEDVGTFPTIVILQKSSFDFSIEYSQINSIVNARAINETTNNFKLVSSKTLNSNNWLLSDFINTELILKLEKNHPNLGKHFDNNFLAGIKTGLNDVLIISSVELKALFGNDENSTKLFRPICFGKEINKYTYTESIINYVFFPYEYSGGKQALINLENHPKVFSYFNQFKDKLSSRAIIKEGIVKGTHQWYELQQINKFFNYSSPKIIYPDIALDNRFLFEQNDIVPDMTCFFIPSDKLEYIPILNSIIFKFLASNYCPILGEISSGGRIRYKSTYLSKIPLPNLSMKVRDELLIYYQNNLALRKKHLELVATFHSRIRSNFIIEKPSNKLKEFYNYDFKTFLCELKKKKVTLTLKQQDEWEQYFNEYKTEINKLQQQITQIDKEIDQLVYKLYGLTADEIKIVEESIK